MTNEQHFQLSPLDSGRLPTLRDIAGPLFRHRNLLVVTFVVLVSCVILGIVVLPNTYQAEMMILVKHERIDSAVSSAADVSEVELNSEVELLKGRDLLEKVVIACGLQNRPLGRRWSHFSSAPMTPRSDHRDDPKSVAQAVVDLERNLDIQPLRKTNLIQVTYDSSDPELSARVLRTLENIYLEKTVAVHRPPGALDFFQAESDHYNRELQDAETHLTTFHRDKGIADPQLEKQIAIQKLAEFDSVFKSTRVAIKEQEKRAEAVKNQLASTPSQTSFQVRTYVNPYLMQQLKTTLLNLQLKRSELLDKFEPSYRPVQEIEEQIKETSDAISNAEKSPVREETSDRNPTYEWLQSEFTKSNAELASLHARATETQDVVGQYRAQLGSIDLNGATQENLVREVKEAEGNYLLYEQKREEARISDALDRQRIVNVAVAEAPIVPALPKHPHWALTLLLGVLFAGIVSPGLAFVVDYLDPSLRTPAELQTMLQVPVLAALPKGEE